jgi:hypothetical protein
VERFGDSTFFTIGGNQLAEGETFTTSGADWTISYIGGSGNDVTLTVVPEPSSTLLLAGVGVLALARRRRR